MQDGLRFEPYPEPSAPVPYLLSLEDRNLTNADHTICHITLTLPYAGELV